MSTSKMSNPTKDVETKVAGEGILSTSYAKNTPC